MGQVADPYEESDDGLAITISGLPGEMDDPDDLDLPGEGAPGAADESTDAPGGAPADDTDGDVVYELDDWSEIERGAVSDRLREAGIPHAWDGTTLLVAAVDVAPVENILDIVEGDPGPPLDAERDQVAYDLSDWDDDQLTALVDALDNARIAHAWDDDELFVYARDEQLLDELLDRVAHPHELAPENDDGRLGAELLGEVFVAADRLQHDPDDHEVAASMIDLGQAVQAADPPYGFGMQEWEHVQGRIAGLCLQLQSPALDEDVVMDGARELRNALRSYV